LSESLSPTSPWGMPFEGADACGAGVAAGAGCLAGLATGAGAGLGAAAACDCFAAAGELGLLLLLLLLPPQLATPTAMSRIAAAVARKVIGLLRVIGSSVRNWDQGGSLPPGRLSSAGGRHICLQPAR
jgi:hypothetical protein